MRLHLLAARQIDDVGFDVIDRGAVVDGGEERRLGVARLAAR